MAQLSDRRRVLQWATFARTWWLYDANHQCPFKSASLLCIYLQGKHKPIYHPLVLTWRTMTSSYCPSYATVSGVHASNVVEVEYFTSSGRQKISKVTGDTGDHVVVINTQHIAMQDRLWRTWRHFRHSGYPGGMVSQRAWEVHRKDPCEVLRKQIYSTLPGNLLRKGLMARLHLFPDEEMPENIASNISNQIRQVMPIPKRLEDYSQEEIDKFPRLFEWPQDHVIREGKISEALKPHWTEDDTKNK